MTIQEQIKQDLKASMVGGDKELTSLLRVIMGEFSRVGKELNDEQALKVIKKMHSNAKDLDNKYEINVLSKYMPVMLEFMQIKTIVAGIINKNGYKGMKDMGNVMKDIKNSPMASQIDGKIASGVAKELL